MSTRLREIVRKRRLLVVQTAEQRGELAVQAAAVRQSLAIVEVVWRGYRHLKSRPVGVAIVAAALAVLGPGKLLRVGYRSGLVVMAVLRVVRIFRMLR
ncbi:MAG TPA: YqjK family protein [Burkholderiales bacterium]|nr:YqjK family protein [Burkholderiales bacterium]